MLNFRRPASFKSLDGFDQNCYKGFTNISAAHKAWDQALTANLVGRPNTRVNVISYSFPKPLVPQHSSVFVVLQGLLPGVYEERYAFPTPLSTAPDDAYNIYREAAAIALGGSPNALLEYASSLQGGHRMFSDKYRERQVKRLRL